MHEVFDRVIDRRNTRSAKWDMMETLYGVPPDEGIAMWVADMDFPAPKAVSAALAAAAAHQVYGYYCDTGRYKQSIVDWMQTRHGWSVDPEWILTTHGLVSAVGLAVQAFSEPGEGVIVFTPVYHAFAKIIRANNRRVVESLLTEDTGRHAMDLDGLEASLTGDERIVILCSPHNPGGTIWRPDEIQAVAAFCAKHDLILISDEVHHDLTMPGESHTVAPLAAPDHLDRLIMLTAASKTFNLAGGMSGNAIISDPGLRARFSVPHQAAGASPNRFGPIMAEAAYSHGAPWLDALRTYLDGNRQVFDDGVNAIPGVRSMRLQATYLAWVDFSGTGMRPEEIIRRVQSDAKIAGNHGATFGTGGEHSMRFNLACARSVVEDAVQRLQKAFSDLQ